MLSKKSTPFEKGVLFSNYHTYQFALLEDKQEV
jgi:hypothetical protein